MTSLKYYWVPQQISCVVVIKNKTLNAVCYDCAVFLSELPAMQVEFIWRHILFRTPNMFLLILYMAWYYHNLRRSSCKGHFPPILDQT